MCLAVPGKILSISGSEMTRMGQVSFGGIGKEACLAFVPEAKVGDYVLVHAGFAISVVDEAEAAETLEYFRQIGELGEIGGQAVKHVDEYRDQAQAEGLAQAIARITTRPWSIMEVCGGQTHAIVKYGIDELLPKQISLLHGPGCPVCVTPLEIVDKALQIAARPEVTFCSFGDMLRVPGSGGDLFSVKAQGGDVRIVYSPLDALKLARENPQRQVVFFAVGFETTAPANAMAVFQAHADKIPNFSVLVSHALVPPAIAAILGAPDNRTQGFLAAGHVCTVMGFEEYFRLAETYHVPIVVTGFEPLDILQGILMCVRQLEAGRAEVENQYARSVQRQGNRAAQALMARVFRVVSRKWRGVGEIPMSGYRLADEFSAYDAELRFGVADYHRDEDSECISGQVLRGVKKPHECPAFAVRCTPERPLGATMVSGEGACAAYYRYRRRQPGQVAPAERG